MTLGDWLADLWTTAIKMAPVPKLVPRRGLRATIRFRDATRLEVHGSRLALGRLGRGDLSGPREFAAGLEKGSLRWQIDPALRADHRITALPGADRHVAIVSRLDFGTIKAAQLVLKQHSHKDSLLLSADDPAIRNFPNAPFVSTGPQDDQAEASAGEGRKIFRKTVEDDGPSMDADEPDFF